MGLQPRWPLSYKKQDDHAKGGAKHRVPFFQDNGIFFIKSGYLMKRNFLSYFTLFLFLAAFVCQEAACLAADGAQKKPSPDEALTMLKDGNKRFVEGRLLHPHSGAARLKQAGTESQNDYAYATVLTCSDSRVPPEMIFDAGIMDIFVVRVAGNICDADEIGSIEYGLAHVRTPVLVVLGHTQCGAVTAATEAVEGKGHALEKNIHQLVDNIEPAVKRAKAAHPELKGDALVEAAIEENVWQAIDHLFMKSHATRELVKKGQTKVIGAIYDVGTGKVNWLPEAKVQELLKKAEVSPGAAKESMTPGSGHEGRH